MNPTAPILPSAGHARAAGPFLFHPFVDRLLRLDRKDRATWLRDVNRGLDAFPCIGGGDRRVFLRGVVLHDAINRIVFRLNTRFPALSVAIARLIPVAGSLRDLMRIGSDRPIILALMHFGPIFFVYTIISRAFRKRTIYALHAGGEFADATASYLRRIGVTPLVNDERALRFLAAKMVEDPNCVLAFGYDYLGRRSRLRVPFLGSSVYASRGLAYLADLSNAAVFTAWGESDARGPRAVVGELTELDRTLPDSGARQRDLMERLFAQLETRVRRYPQVWSEWRNVGTPHDDKPAS